MQGLQLQEQDVFEENQELIGELLEGLCQESKAINPKFFYDELGSSLFEKIMKAPEYYPTRTELSLLKKYQYQMADEIGSGHVLIEPGAGNCEKVRHLLPALRPKCYVPIDISAEFLFSCARNLKSEFKHIDIYPIADDMKADIQLPNDYSSLQKTIFYPGSTIGNYTPEEALLFLKHIRKMMGDEGGLLIGVDLQKEESLLNQAYNDAEGVTAAFNLNVLSHANRLLNSDFDTELFDHVAFYNRDFNRIEMHLQSVEEQKVKLGNTILTLEKDERIHTEYSYKYTLESFSLLAKKAGLKPVRQWVDDEALFSLQYFKAI